MFELREHGRDAHDHQPGGREPRRWFSICDACAHSGIFARPSFGFSDAGCAQLVVGHRAEGRHAADLLVAVEPTRHPGHDDV
jgi:hypothetical protein